MKSAVIVADAGPLIALAKCDQLPLLAHFFNEVNIPQTVLLEAIGGKPRDETESIKAFVDGNCIVQPDRDDALVQHLQMRLDSGESQAISLAKHLDCAILIDEKLGRLMAQAQGLPVFGVLGLLLLAKQSGQIPAVKPLIEQLRNRRYNLSDSLIAAVLHQAAET